MADKYNLTYSSGIEKLYEQAFEAHKGISTAIKNEKLAEQRAEEREEYNTLVKYAEYYGREKKQAMLTDRMEELRKKAKLQDEGAKMLLRSGQQKELDWAILGGAANGIGGVGIIGMGVSGAEPGKTYQVTFTGYKLWLMEK